MANYSSIKSGNLSATGTWNVATIPGTGLTQPFDTILINPTHIVNIDIPSVSLGSTTTSVGSAIIVTGTSPSNFGTLIINSGVTLNLYGKDTTNNKLIWTSQYSQSQLQPYCNIIGNVPFEYGSVADFGGMIIATGAPGQMINFSAANGTYLWNYAVTGEALNSNSTWPYETSANKACAVLGNGYISNLAGTGLGSYGNSSLSFSNVSPVGELSSEVISEASVTGVGQYWVDYITGLVVFYHPSNNTVTFIASYQKLATSGGWGIQCLNPAPYSTAQFSYCNFNFLGANNVADQAALIISSKVTPGANGGSTNNIGYITNSQFFGCATSLDIRSCSGTITDPILVSGNTFYYSSGVNACIFSYRAPNTCLSIVNNILDCRTFYTPGYLSFPSISPNFTMIGNSGRVGVFFAGTTYNTIFPSGKIIANTLDGFGMGGNYDHRLINSFGGTSGAVAYIGITGDYANRNIFRHAKRFINISPWLSINNTEMFFGYHHEIMGPIEDDVYCNNVSITDCLFAGGLNSSYNNSSSIDIGYNHRVYMDKIVISNCTFANTKAAIGFGDTQDNQGNSLLSNIEVKNLLIYGCQYAYQRALDTTTEVTKCHVLELDYNLYNSLVTNTYNNISGNGTFWLAGSKYNYLTGVSRNIPGVALFSPTKNFPATGISLTYSINTPEQDITLYLNGASGNAQQLIFPAGGYGQVASGMFLTNASIPNAMWVAISGNNIWASNTVKNNSACPISRYLKFTNGSLSGQVFGITNILGTTPTQFLTAVPLPANGIITYAANTNPIVISGSINGLNNYDTVRIQGVVGNTAANGTFIVSGVTPQSFSLPNTAGNGVYNANSSAGYWVKVPANGDGYVIYNSELYLSDGLNGVFCGVYPPSLPILSGTYTDSNLTFSVNDVTGSPNLLNPNFVGSTGYKFTVGSAAIGVGTTGPNVPSVDFYGNTTNFSSVDVGFFQLLTSSPGSPVMNYAGVLVGNNTLSIGPSLITYVSPLMR